MLCCQLRLAWSADALLWRFHHSPHTRHSPHTLALSLRQRSPVGGLNDGAAARVGWGGLGWGGVGCSGWLRMRGVHASGAAAGPHRRRAIPRCAATSCRARSGRSPLMPGARPGAAARVVPSRPVLTDTTWHGRAPHPHHTTPHHTTPLHTLHARTSRKGSRS